MMWPDAQPAGRFRFLVGVMNGRDEYHRNRFD
jgi:hypothetical protein